MRGIARQKLGYYPLPQNEAERIRRFLSFRGNGDAVSVLDPCAGGGAALATITSGAKTVRHAIELDAFRAEEARSVLDHVIQGNCFDVHSAVESFSLLFENPPYDFEVGENRNSRMEYLFLEHTYRWLTPGGVLVLVTRKYHNKTVRGSFREAQSRLSSAKKSTRPQEAVTDTMVGACDPERS